MDYEVGEITLKLSIKIYKVGIELACLVFSTIKMCFYFSIKICL